jgi:hypothetical protein
MQKRRTSAALKESTCPVHPRGRNSVTRQEIQEIKPQISRIRAIRRGSLAAEKEMLDAAAAAFHKGVVCDIIMRGPYGVALNLDQ